MTTLFDTTSSKAGYSNVSQKDADVFICCEVIDGMQTNMEGSTKFGKCMNETLFEYCSGNIPSCGASTESNELYRAALCFWSLLSRSSNACSTIGNGHQDRECLFEQVLVESPSTAYDYASADARKSDLIQATAIMINERR